MNLICKIMANKKRYIQTITVYTYGDTAQEAFNEAQSMCDEINHKYDSKASIEAMHEQPFGTLVSEPINLENLKK